MMSRRLETHVDILFSRIDSHGAQPFFKSVHQDAAGGLRWDIKTYAQSGEDINTLCAHLKSIFQRDGVPDGAVVGVCLNGLTYSDIVHIYAVSKAGYIPNLLSTYLTDPTAILKLLSRTGTEAFLHEPGFNLGTDHTIRAYSPIDLSTLEPVSAEDIPSPRKCDPEDIAFIQYSSGSTADLPKVVPCSHKWFQSVYDSWESAWNPAGEGEPQDVFNIPGPVSFSSGLHTLLIGIYFGGAFTQSTTPVFSSDELLLLVSQCGLNRLNAFAPVLSLHIQAAKKRLESKDDAVYRALLNMRSIVYGGMPMMPIFEEWAFSNKLPIMNALGTTETGPLLRCSLGEHPQRMRPFSGLELEFVPQSSDSTQKEKLFKLAILPSSPNTPNVSESLRDFDGKFFTGDLFSKNEDGSWSHRGRDNDWIKIEAAKLVYTTNIENFVRLHCSDIVSELVVVGNGRPSLAILAEAVNPAASGKSAKDAIVARMTSFHEQRYTWERISADKIVFVGRGSLPKTATKGNVRRKVAEAKFVKELDSVYAT